MTLGDIIVLAVLALVIGLVVRGMIRACMGSVSRLCVIQMQDYLELGAFARMNFPGTLSANNWTWRAPKGFITEELTKRIFDITQRYGRL